MFRPGVNTVGSMLSWSSPLNSGPGRENPVTISGTFDTICAPDTGCRQQLRGKSCYLPIQCCKYTYILTSASLVCLEVEAFDVIQSYQFGKKGSRRLKGLRCLRCDLLVSEVYLVRQMQLRSTQDSDPSLWLDRYSTPPWPTLDAANGIPAQEHLLFRCGKGSGAKASRNGLKPMHDTRRTGA